MVAAAARGWLETTLAPAAAVLLLLLTTATGAQSPAAAPGPAPGGAGLDSACLNALLNMSDCLAYVQNGSTARRPDKPCCPELAGLVESNPVCLCELLSGAGDSYGIAVDYSRALALPAICRVATPPVSTCAGTFIITTFGYNVHLGPAAAPTPAAGSPSAGDSPLFPGSSPFASPPPSTTSRAARSLVAFPLAAAGAAIVAGMFYN
ncbi:hypothetical protein GUJ93_ZPchr0010g10478 [Zizania palustris]|uniref:Bifunctional inhibitor/plant lipid transfer protein/seed storage helical domain-containing protein n=1 Tax=Zizania palustris TaxID=103762 RepID=A0A8J6BD96_ZIZPA|nr:hypothetical protein GUJ93_ZPchr0010g10478 [Zizania palustris]